MRVTHGTKHISRSADCSGQVREETILCTLHGAAAIQFMHILHAHASVPELLIIGTYQVRRAVMRYSCRESRGRNAQRVLRRQMPY